MFKKAIEELSSRYEQKDMDSALNYFTNNTILSQLIIGLKAFKDIVENKVFYISESTLCKGVPESSQSQSLFRKLSTTKTHYVKLIIYGDHWRYALLKLSRGKNEIMYVDGVSDFYISENIKYINTITKLINNAGFGNRSIIHYGNEKIQNDDDHCAIFAIDGIGNLPDIESYIYGNIFSYLEESFIKNEVFEEMKLKINYVTLPDRLIKSKQSLKQLQKDILERRSRNHQEVVNQKGLSLFEHTRSKTRNIVTKSSLKAVNYTIQLKFIKYINRLKLLNAVFNEYELSQLATASCSELFSQSHANHALKKNEKKYNSIKNKISRTIPYYN
ncbi:hypothetical protein [Piscirickettsia litoralis]|uniref:Ubiquitin-like protease family profile domain-containing protein n=1 Tax=Piscirickettsia litoralis TaxID=1891921 RepID=A0ABX3A7T1_9GAMM|nr:hypothetical protein [Piscirickettsia litoralis]ODN43688.1 hypothetical protein BGC07_13240 [Piscirickettsia litoralis]